jgi:hypothetical protein
MAINAQKVIVGGIAAGIVMNVLGFLGQGMLLGARMNAEMDAVVPGLSQRMMTGATIAVNVITQLVIGVLLVWLYAAMRPRFGPGFKTAAYAALVIWLCGLLFYSGWYLTGMMLASTYVFVSLVALVTLLAGAYVGGMLYKEEGAGAPSMASARV